MRDTVLLVGNGLTIDFIRHAKVVGIDSSKPFSMTVPCGNPKMDDILDKLEELREYVSAHKHRGPCTDFDICWQLALDTSGRPWGRDDRYWVIHAQMRHYLCLAYSTMQIAFDQAGSDGWPFLDYLSKWEPFLLGCISFNYDLLLQRALGAVEVGYRRYRICNECNRRGLVIFKPHGSIDFEAGPGTFYWTPESRFTNVSALNEAFPMVSLAPGQYLDARLFADLVLPSEPSAQTKLSWVGATYKWYGHGAIDQAADCVGDLILGR